MGELRKPIIFLLAFFVIAASIGSWYSIEQKLAAPHVPSLWVPLAVFTIWSILTAALFLIVDSKILAFALGAVSLAGAIFFSGGFLLVGAAAIAASLLLGLAHARMRRQKELMTKIRIWRILQRGLPFFFTGIALLIATMYYVSPPARSLTEDFFISRHTFDRWTRPLALIVNRAVPQYGFDTPLDDLLRANLEKQADDMASEFIARGFSKEDARALVEKKLRGLILEKRAGLAQSTGTELTGKETLGDLAYTFFSKQLNALEPYRDAVGVVVAVGIFLTIKTASIVLAWIVTLGVIMLFGFLRAFGLVRIGEIQVPKETIIVP